MKTKEFIRRVEELGFDAEERGDEVYLYGRVSNGLAKISKKFKYTINTFYREFMDLNEGDKDLLFDLIVRYISTPVDEREEEKKFYLKHRWLAKARDYKTGFLNYDPCNDILFIHSEYQTHLITTQFTLKEIEEIKEKFDTDLVDFELVEVVDD